MDTPQMQYTISLLTVIINWTTSVMYGVSAVIASVGICCAGMGVQSYLKHRREWVDYKK